MLTKDVLHETISGDGVVRRPVACAAGASPGLCRPHAARASQRWHHPEIQPLRRRRPHAARALVPVLAARGPFPGTAAPGTVDAGTELHDPAAILRRTCPATSNATPAVDPADP